MAQRAALDRIMDTKLKLLFRAMSRTLQVAVAAATAVVEAVITHHTRTHRIHTHHHTPQATAAAEVGEDSPIFPAFQVNSLTFSAVLGSEKEKAPKTRLPNPALMHRRTHLPSHHTATDRIGLFSQSPLQTNRRPMRRPTHHPTHRVTLNHLEKVIDLLTVSLRDSSVIAVELKASAALGVVSGSPRPRSPNHKVKEKAQTRGRTIGGSGTLKMRILQPRRSPTLSRGSDSEVCARYHGRGRGMIDDGTAVWRKN